MQYSYVPVNGEPVILEGVQVPRAGLQFPAEYHLFNKYVPKVLNRYINNVLSNYINDTPGDTLEEVNFLKQFKQATGGDPVASQTNPLTGGIGLSAGDYGLVAPMVRVYNPSALALWRRKRARASAVGAGRPAVVAFVGDSIVYGIQSNGSATETTGAASDGTYVGETNWPVFAAAIANAKLGKSAPVVWDAQDTRVTAVSAASVSSVGLNGRSKQITSTGPGTLTFPATTCKRFEIGYFETTTANGDTASGGFSHAVDGGAATNVNTASAVRVGKIATTTAAALASHQLVLTGITAAPAYISHVIAYADGGIAISRFGRGGWSLGDSLGLQANNSVSAAGQGRLLAAYAQSGWHDMVLIEFAHNDPTQYDVAQYGAYLDSIIAACPATMPIGLIAPPLPPAAQETATYGVRADYVEMMKTKALANANVFHARVADAFGSHDTAEASGLYAAAGTVHPSSAGYGLAGQWLADLLLA